MKFFVGCFWFSLAAIVLGSPTKAMVGGRNILAEPTGRMPYDAEVEYLASEGNEPSLGPYIMSQYKIEADNIFECDVSFSADSVGSKVILGRNAGTWECFIRYNGIGYFGGGSFNMGASFKTGIRYLVKFDLTAGNMALSVNGTVVKTSTGKQIDRNLFPLFIVASGAQNLLNENVAIRIHGFKAWVSDTLVEDFVPVRFTNEQGMSEGAMYDRVSGQLFRNQGTGAFIIGPDKH